MKKTLLCAALLALLVHGQAIMANEASDAGKAVVERLHATLLDVMTTADSLGFAGRVDKLRPVLAETFDFETIARIVTGKYWKTLSEEQRGGFVELFARLSTATYASNFDGYTGETFETLGVEERRGNLLVNTVIAKADGDTVSLDYVLHESDGMWQIVNVIADGVSDLSLKRADYTVVIKNEGFDSLVGKLNDKVTGYGATSQ